MEKITFGGKVEIYASNSITLNGQEFIPTDAIAWLKITMMHSLPASHSVGAFSYKTLRNSLHTIPHNPISLEHQREYLGLSKGDKQVGHIAMVYLPDVEGNPAVPTEPVPVIIMAALYKTNADARRILSEIVKWGASMEALSSIDESAFYYDGKFISMSEASDDMKSCISASLRIYATRYKEKPITVCWGGEDGTVQFSGLGLTQSPADTKALPLALAASMTEGAPIYFKGEENLSNKHLTIKESMIETGGKEMTKEEFDLAISARDKEWENKLESAILATKLAVNKDWEEKTAEKELAQKKYEERMSVLATKGLAIEGVEDEIMTIACGEEGDKVFEKKVALYSAIKETKKEAGKETTTIVASSRFAPVMHGKEKKEEGTVYSPII